MIKLFLKVATIAYVLGLGTISAHRFLNQRDEMIQIERLNTVIKATALQGSVNCVPS